MIGINFVFDISVDEAFAEYDYVGDCITVYLPQFVKFNEIVRTFGETKDYIIVGLLVGVLGHEYTHHAISQIVDTEGDQEHIIIESMNDWIDQIDP